MNRVSLAAIAFAFHAPGLRLLAGYRLHPPILRLNLAAIALTLAAMTAAGLLERRWPAVFWAWLVCHFLWSACLTSLVLAGRAGSPGNG